MSEMTQLSGHAHSPLDEVIALSRSLRLKYLREQVPEILLTAKAQRWEPAEVIRTLLIAEVTGRSRSGTEARRKRSHLPTGKTFAVFDEEISRIARPTVSGLKNLEWVGRAENLVVCGPSGTGKSHFLEAIGHLAIESGKHVMWFSVETLGALVRAHRIDDTIAKALAPLAKVDLVIVDDLGMLPMTNAASEGLYYLIDQAYERRSVAVSSNLHPSAFDQIMHKNLATALVDRLLHHAHVVITEGESIRLTEATTGKGVVPLDR